MNRPALLAAIAAPIIAVSAIGAATPASAATVAKSVTVAPGGTKVVVLQQCRRPARTCGGWAVRTPPRSATATLGEITIKRIEDPQPERRGVTVRISVAVKGVAAGSTTAVMGNSTTTTTLNIMVGAK